MCHSYTDLAKQTLSVKTRSLVYNMFYIYIICVVCWTTRKSMSVPWTVLERIKDISINRTETCSNQDQNLPNKTTRTTKRIPRDHTKLPQSPSRSHPNVYIPRTYHHLLPCFVACLFERKMR